MEKTLSNYEKTVELLKAGNARLAVAESLGLMLSTVQVYEAKARRAGLLPSIPKTENFVKILLPDATVFKISSYAEKLGLTPEQLMAKLLVLVARDDLFKAVIDD